MSDDYRDDDSHGGGLWDPDAFGPPPPSDRPTLRVITSGQEDDPSQSQGLFAQSDDELVRLDQFRPVEVEAPPGRRWGRGRATAFGAAAVAIAALTITAIELGARGGGHQPRAIARFSIDAQQGARGREAPPPHAPAQRPAHPHHTHARAKPEPHTHTTTSVSAQVRSTPSSQTQQVSRPSAAAKPKKTMHQYDALSAGNTAQLTQPVAASEFGFEN
jgi:hypothetical protein